MLITFHNTDFILFRINLKRYVAPLFIITLNLHCISDAFSSQIIYGTQNAAHITGKSLKRIYFLQLGAFTKKSNAQQLARKIQTKTQYPVIISHSGNTFVVRVGPVNTQELHQLSIRLSQNSNVTPIKYNSSPKQIPTIQTKPQILVKETSRPLPIDSVTKEMADNRGSWYVAAKIGGQETTPDDQFTVNNDSGFASPFDKDIYTNSSDSSLVLGIGGGYRFTNMIIPAISVGIYYTHFFNMDINGQVIQYSLPEFTNYNYQWKVKSDLVLASAKANVISWKNLMPFVQGGVGVSSNRASQYYESALPDVTPRISPNFANHTTTVFAYQLGAGLDWEIKPQWLLSLGYEYSDLGKVRSGYGTDSWNRETLSSKNLTSNAGILGFTYLFHG
ncbi:TPA: outer membrane beta-barrel protein [Legionella pneumophila]|nr:outer membrane beta-barrel protein [Legionella pneumophila]